jgi:hypothetical protein
MQVYEQFLRDSDKVSLYKKISFYWKIWVYSFVLLFLMFSIYAPFIDNKAKTVTKITQYPSWALVKYTYNQDQIVKADYVWRVIETIWDFKIQKDWILYDTDYIFDWDEVMILSW